MACSFKPVEFTVLIYRNICIFIWKLCSQILTELKPWEQSRLFQKGTIKIQSILWPCIITFKLNIKFKTSVVYDLEFSRGIDILTEILQFCKSYCCVDLPFWIHVTPSLSWTDLKVMTKNYRIFKTLVSCMAYVFKPRYDNITDQSQNSRLKKRRSKAERWFKFQQEVLNNTLPNAIH